MREERKKEYRRAILADYQGVASYEKKSDFETLLGYWVADSGEIWVSDSTALQGRHF